MELSSPDSLLGQVQRGLGGGFVRALHQPPRVVHDLIEQCIVDDPCWDHQLDSRGDYYAQLALATKMDLAPVERQLIERDDHDQSTARAWLAIETLGALARRGSDTALSALRLYVATGYWWESALREIVTIGQAEAWAGLDEAIDQKFADDEELKDEICSVAFLDEPPWNVWSESDGRLSRIIRAVQTEEKRRSRKSRLRSWNAALSAAKKRGDLELFSEAKRIIEQDQEPIAARVTAGHALTSLPSHLVLPLARQWRSSRLRRLRTVAGDILIRHATAEDLGWIRKQLRKPITDGRVYAVCDLVQMLLRFPHDGPFAVLDRIYGGFPYSYGRRHVVTAMAATDPGFAGGLAFECLWDCESETRAVACDSVELSLPGSRRRLDELASDHWEEEEVRKIARRRLRGQKESALP